MSKRKFIYILSASAVIIISIAAAIFFTNKLKSEREKDALPKRESHTVRAVPVDAIAVYCFENLKILKEAFLSRNSSMSKFVDNSSGLYKFINTISSVKDDTTGVSIEREVLLSLHYSAKNDVSLLFILEIGDMEHTRDLVKESITKKWGVKKRTFGKTEILNCGDFCFSFFENLLLASSSPIVLESSIRHLESKSSILDNRDFAQILNNSKNNSNMLFVNNQQIGKLFSGVIDRKFWWFSDFVQTFSTWTMQEGEFHTNYHTYVGPLTNIKGVGNYSSMFKGMVGTNMRAWDILPYNTYIMLTIPIGDLKLSMSRLKEYLELSKSLKESSFEQQKKWFTSQNPVELTLAYVPFGGSYQWITIIRHEAQKGLLKSISRLWNIGDDENKIKLFENKGYLENLFGRGFSFNIEKFYVNIGDWTIIGSESILKQFVKGDFQDFSIKDYIRQTGAYGKIDDKESLMTLIVNSSENSDTLASVFKPTLRAKVTKELNDPNIEILVAQILSKEDEVFLKVLAFADKVDHVPVPKVKVGHEMAGWEQDTIVKIPSGPFELVNSDSGKKEYLEQLPNYKLRLLDNNKKGVWAVPFSTPIRGFVAQVDYFNNKKSQMLFASGNELYLLDRRGRFLENFPKRVDSLILLGPKTFDIKDDGNFSIMLLHIDNTLRLYDKNCKPYPAWKEITVKETIKGFPSILKVGNKKYWVLRTALQTYLYTINGNSIVKESKKNQFKPDTDIKVISEKEVVIKTINDKEVVLNLENGKTKKRKK